MYEPRIAARGFWPDDPRFERGVRSDQSSEFMNVTQSSSEDDGPLVQTNSKSVADYTSQRVKDNMDRNRREVAEQKKTYLREFTKNDSQKALIDFNQSQLAPELLKEK